ncbi:MAG TPA: CHASE domain-containing protein [Polyangiaceae bacterium]|nr:CHASE domain-containing protein [Polyangiaceae bacterium]
MSDSEERPRSELGSGAKPVDAGARGLSSGITPAQRSRAWLITGAGIALSLVACALAQHRENAQNRDAFDRRASVLTGAIARSFQMTREVVLSLPALFEASVRVEQREFTTFVRPALQRHPSLAALEWAPLVKQAEREAFEAKMRQEGFLDFEIREPGSDGKMVRSGVREQYLPLAYLQPAVEAVRGLEVLFEPVRRVEIQAAIDQGSLHVSHRFRLVEDPEGVQSVAVYAPGYDPTRLHGAPAQRREALRGLGIALFRLRPLIDAALATEMREGIAIALYDPAAPADVRVLYESAPGTIAAAERAGMVHRETFEFGNRRYTVLSSTRLPDTWTPWLALLVGLTLTLAATGGYVTLATIGRLRQTVAERINLGQYTLEEKIGEGGMGVVYRATHAMLRRPAAIKLLLKERAGERDLARFEREVQLTSRLAHPNTISIFDYGRTADGLFYYVMEFLDGMDLERLVREDGPMSAGRAIHILAQASGALAEAHLLGLIHRDIKPANIVLTERRDEPDVVKVVDFGLAKTLEPGPGEAGITRVNSITGTPLYLAPEAISTPESVHGRADLYALGAVAYFILTGQHVFEASSVMEVLSKHMFEQPIPLSERLGRPIASDLERLVLSCLAKDKNARPQSAAVLRAALLACEDAQRYDMEAARVWWRERGTALRTGTRLGQHNTGHATTMAIDLQGRPVGDATRRSA